MAGRRAHNHMSPYTGNMFNVLQPPDDASSRHGGGARASVLPLNIIAMIISHLDNVADLARVCQSSRVLHYMTLPQLYKNMTLYSYNTIRYKDDRRPEGCGSGSPFSMALNALVTRNVSNLVRTLALHGDWKEHNLLEYSQVGRVPDDLMMLNIAVRAAADRCTFLESFKWDLTTKLLAPVYQGLVGLAHLRDLHVRFPSSRSPRPTIELPPMPNLTSFTMTHYDPLCYPDDISTLLLHATKLTKLVLHFSPRMRDAGEPSVQLFSLFRKNIAARRPLRLKTFGLYHLYALHNVTEMEEAIDVAGVEEVAFLNTFGVDEDLMGLPTGANGSGGLFTFIDGSWENRPRGIVKMKSMRFNRFSRSHARMLGEIEGLERLYLVNARHVSPTAAAPASGNPDINGAVAANETTPPGSGSNSLTPPTAPNNATTGSSNSSTTPATASTATTNCAAPSTTTTRRPGLQSTTSSSGPVNNTPLLDLYINSISLHGSSLRHLILPARWPLPPKLTAKLFSSCPGLTQLALSMDCSGFVAVRLLVMFLKHLWAFRILDCPRVTLPDASPQESGCGSGCGSECGSGSGSGSGEGERRGGSMDDKFEAIQVAMQEGILGRELADLDRFGEMRYVGVVRWIWEIGGVYELDGDGGQDGDGDGDGAGAEAEAERGGTWEWEHGMGESRRRRRLRRIGLQDVRDVEIWKMDSLDVV